MPTLQSRFRGCLLGGATGDALGAAVEFMSLGQIHAQFGPRGIRDYALAYGRTGAITDDTQMTLFTADGLLRAMMRGMLKGIGGAEVSLVKDAYLRWLQTQGCPVPKAFRDRHAGHEQGWLITHRELFAQRAPGNTCIQALLHTPYEHLRADNQSKGCGTVMRTAPVAMFATMLSSPSFTLAADLAAITHGHPTALESSGAFAVLLQAIFDGESLHSALDESLQSLRDRGSNGETERALLLAQKLATDGIGPDGAIPQLGEGWVAEEALAISVYCALVAKDFEDGVCMAVNITGDSDSTGSITGNILGALLGEEAIPARWLEELELREVIEEVAGDFVKLRWDGCKQDSEEEDWWSRRYPGF